jgi:hypothetical protein
MKIVYGDNEEYLYSVNFWEHGDFGFAIVRAKSVSHAEILVLDKFDKNRTGEIHVFKVKEYSNLDDPILTSHVED